MSSVPAKTSAAITGTESNLSEEEMQQASEERKATGRSIAIIIFLSLMVLALYHVIARKTTILAGVLVPALILFTYTFFVIHVNNRDKKKRKQLEESGNANEILRQSDMKKSDLENKFSTNTQSFPIASTSSGGVSVLQQHPSSRTLVKIMNADRRVSPDIMNFPNRPIFIITKHPSSKSMTKMDAKVTIDPKVLFKIDSNSFDPKATIELRKIPPFKKTQSQSQFQLKDNQTTHIFLEHETKKVKRSLSFDRSIDRSLVEPHHMMDNKKNQNKALNRPQKK